MLKCNRFIRDAEQHMKWGGGSMTPFLFGREHVFQFSDDTSFVDLNLSAHMNFFLLGGKNTKRATETWVTEFSVHKTDFTVKKVSKSLCISKAGTTFVRHDCFCKCFFFLTVVIQ